MVFRAHTATVRSVDISADNLEMVTGSDDKTIKVRIHLLLSLIFPLNHQRL